MKSAETKPDDSHVVLVWNVPDGRQQVLVLAQDVLQEGLLKLGDLARFHFVQVAPDPGVDDGDLFFNGHGSWTRKGEVRTDPSVGTQWREDRRGDTHSTVPA